MAHILSSSILLLFILSFSAVYSIDFSCKNPKRIQFFGLFQPKISSPLPKINPHIYPRHVLIPSSIETDEINATEQCATTLLDQSLDVAPPHNFANESGIDPGLAEIDENTTHLASNESAPSAPDVEPPVVTFEEWTKQKLEQEKLKHHSVTNGNHQNVDHLTPSTHDKAAAQITETVSTTVEEKIQTSRVVHTVPLVVSQRNYASRECGAKVIEANTESENRGAVLNDKEKDEYMRNPCVNAKEKFLVIELCETIQPTSIELANYEYFSSSPKSFRILASERQPPLEWTPLGEFEAADTRDVQTFQMPEHSVYTKFIRLELISHYGKEHYCTLSAFRVYGISMVDEYEAEATAAASYDTIDSPGIPLKSTTPEMQINDSHHPAEEPLVTAPSMITSEVIPPSSESSSLDSLNIAEPVTPIIPQLPQWKFRECPKCGDKHSKAVTTWLCYVFSPSLCSQRNIKVNSTTLISRGQLKFLKFILMPSKVCPTNNGITEKKTEEALIVPSPKPQEVVLTHTVETEVKQQTIIQQKQAATIPLPAGTTSHKESVFLKLNKRLASLELNISLSSQYLTELSRQYVAQTEENRKNHERVTKFIEESIAAASQRLSKQFEGQISEVKEQIHDLFKRFKAFPQTSSSNIAHGKFEHKGEGSLMIRHHSKDRCSTDYDDIYLDESDGLWTTKQLVVVIAVMQVSTFAMIFTLQYLWKTNAQNSQKVALISSDIDVRKIIAAEIQNELRQLQQQQKFNPSTALVIPNISSSSSSEHPILPTTSLIGNEASPSKKKRKKKRNNTNNLPPFITQETEKWDSASVSSNMSAVSTSTSVCNTTLSSLLKKKGSTASRDSCFTSDSTENVPPELSSAFHGIVSSNPLQNPFK